MEQLQAQLGLAGFPKGNALLQALLRKPLGIVRLARAEMLGLPLLVQQTQR